MLKILLLLFAGIALGAMLRNKPEIVRVNNKIIIWIIVLLLFFMGVSVGNNSLIMNNLDVIGLQGIQFAVVAVLGSVALSWLVYKAFFKNGVNTNGTKRNNNEG